MNLDSHNDRFSSHPVEQSNLLVGLSSEFHRPLSPLSVSGSQAKVGILGKMFHGPKDAGQHKLPRSLTDEGKKPLFEPEISSESHESPVQVSFLHDGDFKASVGAIREIDRLP